MIGSNMYGWYLYCFNGFKVISSKHDKIIDYAFEKVTWYVAVNPFLFGFIIFKINYYEGMIEYKAYTQHKNSTKLLIIRVK